MLIVCFFLHIKSLPNLLFGVLCLPGDQSHPFAQLTINPLACCICCAGLLGRAVFPPWNEGPNFGSYTCSAEIYFWNPHQSSALLALRAAGMDRWAGGQNAVNMLSFTKKQSSIPLEKGLHSESYF